MTKYIVKILHGLNNQNFEIVDKQRFNLFISPAIITEAPIAPYTFNSGSYRTVTLNNMQTINVTSNETIFHAYPYLDMVTIKFEDIQCHSKSHQYYVSFTKVV